MPWSIEAVPPNKQTNKHTPAPHFQCDCVEWALVWKLHLVQNPALVNKQSRSGITCHWTLLLACTSSSPSLSWKQHNLKSSQHRGRKGFSAILFPFSASEFSHLCSRESPAWLAARRVCHWSQPEQHLRRSSEPQHNHTATKTHHPPSAHPAHPHTHGIFPLGKNGTQFGLDNSPVAKSKAISDTFKSYKATRKKITFVKQIANGIRAVWDSCHHLVLAHLPCIRNGWVAYP